jgi:hypothetical protein
MTERHVIKGCMPRKTRIDAPGALHHIIQTPLATVMRSAKGGLTGYAVSYNWLEAV